MNPGRRRLTVAYDAAGTPASSSTRRLSGLLVGSIRRGRHDRHCHRPLPEGHQGLRGHRRAVLGGGTTRRNVAITLATVGRLDEALLYADAALRDYATYGTRATTDIERTRELIAAVKRLKQQPTR
jgi:hypothetical protein